MGFQDNIPGVFTRTLNQVGVSGVFYPDSGDSAPCNVIIGHESEFQVGDLDIEVCGYVTTITALRDVVGSPKRGTRFVVGGTTYTVVRPEPDTDRNMAFTKVVVNES